MYYKDDGRGCRGKAVRFSSVEVIKSMLKKYLPVHDLNALRLASGRDMGKKYSTALFGISFSLEWKDNTFTS